MLDIIEEYRKGFLFIRLSGKITKDTYEIYNNEVINMIKENGIRNVVLNFEKIYDIDLKGINILFYTYEIVRNNKGVLMISNMNKLIDRRIIKSHLLNYVVLLDNEIDCLNKVLV